MIPKLLTSKLASFQNRRRFPNWEPVVATTKFTNYNSINFLVLQRLLQFVDLEVSVGGWVTQALGESGFAQAEAFVLRNAQDEAKHETTFRELAAYVGGIEIEPQARALINEWNAQPPSFALAYALEMGVFMSLLPWLNRFGDTHIAQASQWVSDDEQVHVLTNRELAATCGQQLTKDHLSLVARTLAFIFESEDWRDICERALRRLTTGKDDRIIEQSAPTTIKFFEQLNTQTIAYK